tara:strand:+ start:242 stop:1126 length:885 start_codon:yes stop_codon:yes gene_type:complete
MIETKKMFWISSYPKSGNTWLRLILCGLFFTEDGNLNDFKLLRKITSFDNLANFKFTKDISLDDFNLIVNGKEYNEESVLTYSKYWIEAQKRIEIQEGSFGLFKTHNARVKINKNFYTNSSTTLGFLYLSRDPRDIVISYSKYMNIDIDKTIDFLLNGQIMDMKKIDNKMPAILLNWRDHYLSWKKFKDVPNLFLKYEDMLDNVESEILKIINFFNKNYNINIKNQNNKIKNIIESTQFNSLKKKELQYGFEKDSNCPFFRIGQQKQWKKILKQNQINKINKKFNDQLVELNYL